MTTKRAWGSENALDFDKGDAEEIRTMSIFNDGLLRLACLYTADESFEIHRFNTSGVDLGAALSIDVDGNVSVSADLDGYDISDVFAGTEAITALGIGSAVATAGAGARDLVVGTTGASHGITIFASNTGVAAIHFADAASDFAGRFRYNHTQTAFEVFVENTQELNVSGVYCGPHAANGLTSGRNTERWGNTFTSGFTPGYRAVAQDGALVLATTDATIHLDSASGAKSATMTTVGMGTGQRIRVVLIADSGGSYTLACNHNGSSGTVTLDDVGEGVDLVFNGTIWIADQLIQGASFA